MNRATTEHDPDSEPQAPSKTQRKKDSHALQELGERLAELPAEKLRAFDLPEDIAAAIAEGQRIRSHEGRRRHMQLLGKLMRKLDDDAVARLRASFDLAMRQSRADTARLHEIERWRERLLDDDAALTGWMAAHPQTDAQQLRALLRSARKERSEARPPRAFRELFQLLKAVSAPSSAAHDASAAQEENP